jgi:hypothetical protein
MGVRLEPFIDTIEALDFEFKQPCEHSQHSMRHDDEPAAYYIHNRHGCSSRYFFICKGAWDRAFRKGLRCASCDQKGPRSDFWTLISEVEK